MMNKKRKATISQRLFRLRGVYAVYQLLRLFHTGYTDTPPDALKNGINFTSCYETRTSLILESIDPCFLNCFKDF